MECNDDQFDTLVDNVEDMICDVSALLQNLINRGTLKSSRRRAEENEMTEVELRKYKQFVEDSKNLFIPIVRSTRG